MADVHMTIDMDRKCAECGKMGATDSGICLKCCLKIMRGQQMRSRQGQAVAKRQKEARNYWPKGGA